MPQAKALKGLLFCLLLGAYPLCATAEHHDEIPADLDIAINTFIHTYATNEVDTYFDLYAADATVYFYGERQDVDAYHKLWQGVVEAGGGVEINEPSDMQVQMMPSGDVAIVTYFIDNRTRYPDAVISEERAFETEVWQKIDGSWKIVSLHYSPLPEPSE